MLVLSRKQNEQIIIGGDIVLTIIRIDGGKVRLGIEAPPEVSIDRRELHEKKRMQDRVAAVSHRSLHRIGS